MIPDIFFLIVGTVFNMVAIILSPINFIIPAQFTTSLVYLFGYMNYLGGVIDLSNLATGINTLLIFESLWYGYKLLLFLIHLAPVLGNPQHPDTK